MPKRSTPRRHSMSQKLILAINSLLIIGCFAGSAALLVGNKVVGDQQKVPLVPNLADAADAELGPTETFPAADPQASNFLITGADNNSCIDPASPFAGAFGDRSELGERSDTVMVMRVDPSTSQAAVLSFPRDLWVSIPGRDGESKINSAYVKDDPSKLIETIFQNFGVGIDHFIQVDFCAFKTLVDAVGGVPVPFAYITRDTHTGLSVPQAGCFTFSGDHALAYVRSRHYEYWDGKQWIEDPSSDLGRVSRQQDFIRRVVSKALSTGVYTPSVARGLIDTARKYVVTDTNLTPRRMLEFAGVIQGLDPAQLQTYQIEITADERAGQDVLIPRLGGANMKAILAIFRGKASLSGAPIQDPAAVQAATSTVAPVTALPSAGAVTTTTTPASTTVAPTTTTTQPGTAVTENVQGVVPPKDQTC
jgi:LCP family protein required for cell wall assembly